MNILTQIRELVFRQVAKRAAKREPVFPAYADVKRILILFESDYLERNLPIKEIIKELQADGKVVTAWGYLDKNNCQTAVLRDYRVISNKDCTFLLQPRDYERQDIAQEQYDLLIDLNIHNLLPLRYLALYANCTFRAGKAEQQPYVHDFMVDVKDNDDPCYLAYQILLYLKQINSPAKKETTKETK